MYCKFCGAINKSNVSICSSCRKPLRPVYTLAKDKKPPSPIYYRVLAPHTLLRKRYRIVARVGQGGFSSVYKAHDILQKNMLVAVKEINLERLAPQEMIDATDAFNREVRVLSDLQHPNLPRMHDYFTDTERWYVVMDFIEGETLERYIRQRNTRMMAMMEVLNIGIQLCTVLEYLHMQQPPVIFRDLKPANIMVGTEGTIYLIDFGIARQFKPGQDKDTIAFGSPGYAAPEQYGKAQTTPRADIYSLGAILHEMLTRIDPVASPFSFVSVRQYCSEMLYYSDPGAPQGMPLQLLDKLILSMVDMDPDKRPATMAVVRQELSYIADQHVRHYPEARQTQSKNSSETYQRPLLVMSPLVTEQSQLMHSSTQLGFETPTRAERVETETAPKRSLPLPAQHDNKGLTRRNALIGLGILTTMAMGVGAVGAVYFYAPGSDQPLPNAPLDLKPVGGYNLHTGPVTSLTWAPDGSAIASASSDTMAQIWNPLGYNDVIQQGYIRDILAITTIAWSPDSKVIATGSLDQAVRLWERATSREIQNRLFPAAVNVVAWSPDGGSLAVGCADGTVYICNGQTLEILFTYRKHTKSVQTLAWSRDGAYIASGGKDHSIQVWPGAASTPRYIYKGHTDIVNALTWSPDNTRIASASADHTVQVWDAFSGQHPLIYRGHMADGNAQGPGSALPEVFAVDWQMKGKYIASGDASGAVHIWETATGNLGLSVNSSGKSVRCLAWSPDSSYLASGGDGNTATVGRLQG